MKYIMIMWPESQMLMELPEWEDHCYLVNDDKGLDKFGSAAYFVEEDWYNQQQNKQQASDKSLSIGVQVTGFIKITKDELRKTIEENDDKVIAEAVKRQFTPDGFASLTPWSIDDVNSLLGTNYEFDDFEWNV